MSMDKYAVEDEELLVSLRNEEAQLMQEMQRLLSDPAKTANDRTVTEQRLQAVRHKITEIDGKRSKE